MKAKLTALLCLLWSMFLVAGAVTIDVNVPGRIMPEGQCFSKANTPEAKPVNKLQGRRITQSLIGHGDVRPIALSWYSTETLLASENFFNGNTTETFAANLPPEVEFMVATFTDENRYYFVIREHVSETNYSEYVLDSNEATNRIEFKLVMPDGTEPDFKIWKKEHGQLTVFKDGRIEAMDLTTSIRTPRFKELEVGGLWAFFKAALNPDGEYESPLEMFNPYINDVADDFYFLQIYNAACKDYSLAAVLEGKSGDTMPYSNSADDYYGIDTYVKTPEIYEDFEHYNSSFIIQTREGQMVNWMGPSSEYFKPTYKIVTNTDDSRQSFYVGYCENVMGEDGSDYPYENFYRLTPISHTAPTPGLMNCAGLTLPFGGPYAYMTEGEWSGISWLEFNPAGLIPDTQQELTYGNDCPITVFVPRMNPEDRSYTPGLSVSYIGRYGDYRGSNTPFTSLELRQGDKVLASDNYELQKWCYYNKSRLYEGSFDLNTENTIGYVDDIQIRNAAHMHFEGGIAPPTLQLLQFRNNDGTLTDRFETPGQAKIELMGGAFEYFSVIGEWYQCKDTEVEWTVEYAPYGSDDFTAIDVERDETLGYVHGYGEYLTGSLEKVDKTGPYGWFDVRITLKDTKGNYQTQIISPAFCIESLAGVEKIERTPQVSVRGNNIIVPKDATVYNVAGRICRPTNLSPGIYFVKVDGNTMKIAIR